MAKCDFGEDAYRWIEQKLCHHFPKQITQLVWSKDKAGDHDWDWFEPFFQGYVPRKRQIEVDFTVEFWETYETVCEFVESFPVDYLPLIGEMSGDTQRVMAAIERSKPNLMYLYKVWTDTRGREDFDAPVELPDISKHEVNTVDFD
jgi:hypothetical protein